MRQMKCMLLTLLVFVNVFSAITFFFCYWPFPSGDNGQLGAAIWQNNVLAKLLIREKGDGSWCKCNCAVENLRQSSDALMQAAKHIAEAHRYARSGLAMKLLANAFASVHELAQTVRTELEYEILTEIVAGNNSLDICPEIWLAKGMPLGKLDFPVFEKGFENTNCTNVKPFNGVLTILLNALHDSDTKKNLNGTLTVLCNKYPGINVIIAANQSSLTEVSSSWPNVTIVKIDNASQSERKLWSTLATNAPTPYVLVGRGINYFDKLSHLERLVRVLSYTSADFVGGAYRDIDGKWYAGCMQISLRNYTLKLIEGYDLSYNSCMYCDYLAGPFAVRRNFFTNRLASIVATGGEAMWLELFVDHFLKNKMTTLMCADVMFYTRHVTLSTLLRSQWLPIARKFEINRLVFPDRNLHKFTCEEAGSSCAWDAGLAQPICCIETLSESLRFMVNTFDAHDLLVEGWQGNLMGAVKFHGILPWERDSDFTFHVANYTAIKKLIPEFKARGYSLVPDEKRYTDDPGICMKRDEYSEPCGYFSLEIPAWNVQLWGLAELNSQRNWPQLPTKIACDGFWYSVCPNPGWCLRNQYGDDLFEHIEHVMHLGKGNNNVYKTGSYLKCPRPGFHGCLENYLPVGNLQFRDG